MTWNRMKDVTRRGAKNRAEMGGRRGRRETVCWSRGKREAVQLSVVVLFTKARGFSRPSSRACLALSNPANINIKDLLSYFLLHSQ
jgi:hypothetical protein